MKYYNGIITDKININGDFYILNLLTFNNESINFITKDNLLNKGNIIAIKGYTKKIKKEVFIVPTNISILKKNNL